MIRAFDLGGGGLKTCLFYYDGQTLHYVEDKIQLGICPDNVEISQWIRICLYENTGNKLDDEINLHYLFTFSLAGLYKLREKPVNTEDISILFDIPKVTCIDDGAAHLIGTLNTMKSLKAPIWNFALGTGLGFGFTDNGGKVRDFDDFWKLFECPPWSIIDERSNQEVWLACSAKNGFDKILQDDVFEEFALRWKLFIQYILQYCINDKQWGRPQSIVFTGGHIEFYGDRLIHNLLQFSLDVSIFSGPKNAGLLGAAWNCIQL